MKAKEFRGFIGTAYGAVPVTVTARITIDRHGATLSLSDDDSFLLGVDLGQLEKWIKKVRKEVR